VSRLYQRHTFLDRSQITVSLNSAIRAVGYSIYEVIVHKAASVSRDQ
jgi:hypothetical protein